MGKLLEWEKQNGYTGRFIAGKLGISDSAWSKIKHGKQRLSLNQAMKLKEFFNISDELLKEE